MNQFQTIIDLADKYATAAAQVAHENDARPYIYKMGEERAKTEAMSAYEALANALACPGCHGEGEGNCQCCAVCGGTGVRFRNNGERGYTDAFYEMTAIMGIPALPMDPSKAYREQVLPRLRELVEKAKPKLATPEDESLMLLRDIARKVQELADQARGGVTVRS